jgi:ElaB/YqjD/DUF883 family membrane-anchored ribosome-binding protein
VDNVFRTAQDAAKRGADKLSEGVEYARRNTGPTLAKTTAQVQSVATEAMDSLSTASKRVRATVADVGDSVVTYAQDNPLKSILIAAAVGAIIATAVTTLSRSED